MKWALISTAFGVKGDLRLRYAVHDDSRVRFFLLEPDTDGVLELLYTRVYATLDEGAALLISDYQAAIAAPIDTAGRCAYENCRRPFEPKRKTQRFCSAMCQHRAGSKSRYDRKRKSA